MSILYTVGGLSLWFWLTWNFSPFRYVTAALVVLGIAIALTGG